VELKVFSNLPGPYRYVSKINDDEFELEDVGSYRRTGASLIKSP